VTPPAAKLSDGPVPQGSSVTFGFNSAWNGSDPAPTVTLG
jgi:endo-1,4-beta-xylanase